MASTYNPDLLRTIDRVRKRLADTEGFDPSAASGQQDLTDTLNSDEEIQGMVDAYDEKEATATLAESMAAFYMQEPDRFQQYNGVTLTWAKRAEQLLALATQIRKEDEASAATSAASRPKTRTVTNTPAW